MVGFFICGPYVTNGGPYFPAYMREGGILLNFGLPPLLTPNPKPKERQYGLEIKDSIPLKV